MGALQNKIDFGVVFTVRMANPNGDPLNGNQPRVDYDGYGEVSDVCIKRKIRNRLQDMGERIFVQSDERKDDGCKSLKDRADSCAALQEAKKSKDADLFANIACEQWIDVRSFGQVFAFKGDPLSVGVRGPVSLQTAVSVQPIEMSSMQITKSVNSVTGDKKSSDTMGMKHRVDFGVYVFYGSINPQLAEKTGFSEEDSEKVKQAICTLFENDCSSARPDGSMEIQKVCWWKHNCKSGQYSSAKVHGCLKVALKEEAKSGRSIEDYEIRVEHLDGLEMEEL
ncbi:MAG: type I-C CRISPR-associated protein Cas7/Csd2 [Clostridia bacterium]|nr:type I-C CRISPR-associated protein Cas7/Csd2 [Clostridia bacterium]